MNVCTFVYITRGISLYISLHIDTSIYLHIWIYVHVYVYVHIDSAHVHIYGYWLCIQWDTNDRKHMWCAFVARVYFDVCIHWFTHPLIYFPYLINLYNTNVCTDFWICVIVLYWSLLYACICLCMYWSVMCA